MINTSHQVYNKASINRQHCPTVVSREYKLADLVTNSKEEFSHEKAIFTQLVSKLPPFTEPQMHYCLHLEPATGHYSEQCLSSPQLTSCH
jgi:hypothetical protein